LVSQGCEFEVITTERGFWSPIHEDADPVPGVNVVRVDYPDNLVMNYMKLVFWGGKKIKKLAGRKKVNGVAKTEGAASKEAPRPVQESWIRKGFNQVKERVFSLPLKRAFPHYSKYWASEVERFCLENYGTDQFDVIVATHPYPGTLIAAKSISEKWGIPWVADFRDPWTHDMQSPWRLNPEKLAEMWILEGDILKSASAVVSINRQMCEYLNADSDKMHIVPNSFEPSEYLIEADEPQFSPEKLNLCYTGSVVDEHEYRLFLDGLKICQDRGISGIELHYYGAAFSLLSRYASQIGLGENYLCNHGIVPQSEANQRLSEADMGVVLGWRGPLAKLVSTGKIFELLGVNIGILGVCEIEGSGMEDVIRTSGTGVVLGSAEAIADVLVKALANKQAGGDCRRSLNLEADGDGRNKYTTARTAKKYREIFSKVVN